MGKVRKINDDLKTGLTIYKEIQDMPDLTWMQKSLLSLYAFYTKGRDKGCRYTNREIAEYFGVAEHTLQIWKSELKNLGYIEVINQWTAYKGGTKI